MSRLKHTIYAEVLLQQHAAMFRPFLERAGLGLDVLDHPERQIPLSNYVQLLEIAAEALDPALGLKLGQGLLNDTPSPTLLGGFGHGVRAAADVRAFLEFAMRYLVVHAHANEVSWQAVGEQLEIRYRISDPSITRHRQDAELCFAALYTRLREVTAGKFAALRVDFVHERLADTHEHEKAFACPIRFGQPANLMVWPLAMLDEPLVTADPRLFQALLPGLEEARRRRLADTDLTARLGLAIEACLASGISLDEIAGQLCMSKRTLQRRLQELDLEFNDLVEEIRQALALDLVRRSSLNLTEIATRLGYNESSSFTRAFRRWTGLSPREYRQQAERA